MLYHVFLDGDGSFTFCTRLKLRRNGIWLKCEGHWFFLPYHQVTQIHKFKLGNPVMEEEEDAV